MRRAFILIVCAALISGCGCAVGDDACVARHEAMAELLGGLANGLGQMSASHQEMMDSVRQSDEDFQNYQGFRVADPPPAPDYPTFSSKPAIEMGDPVPNMPGWVYEPNGPVPAPPPETPDYRDTFGGPPESFGN